MNLDQFNKWLTLIANLGVLIGILFLAREIDQSNRIAERDGRTEMVAQEFDLQNSYLENPGETALLVKLSSLDAQLSPLETFQAQTIAQQLVLRSANLTISYETGFLEDAALERQIRGMIFNIRRFPGIAPFIKANMQAMGINEGSVSSPIFQRVEEEMEKILQEHERQ